MLLKKTFLLLGVSLAACMTAGGAQARRFELLYTFHGADGNGSVVAPILDDQGNLYGTTRSGGAADKGTVFKLAPDGNLTTLADFARHGSGAEPLASLWRDAHGNLFGTTWNDRGGRHPPGGGTLFEITASGRQKTLYRFSVDGPFGYSPEGGVIADAQGNLYGATMFGGTYGYGVAYKFTPDGTMTVLHAFGATSDDGQEPVGSLAMDAAGNLYGATTQGGSQLAGGTVFKITPDGTESIVHFFSIQSGDGFTPYGGVLLDTAGNIYGTTMLGGQYSDGTVYKLASDGTETILHSFWQYLDGGQPMCSLVADAQGNLYGTASVGGPTNSGTVFETARDGTFRTLHTFDTVGRRLRGGIWPLGGLAVDAAGNLYGTASADGGTARHIGYGTVFKISAR